MFAGRPAEGFDRHSAVRVSLIKLTLRARVRAQEKAMRGLSYTVGCGLMALVVVSVPQAAMAQDKTGKTCRMEQQCHWENFKKICVWVKVCR